MCSNFLIRQIKRAAVFGTRCSRNMCICDRPFSRVAIVKAGCYQCNTKHLAGFFGEKLSDSSKISNVKVTEFNN